MSELDVQDRLPRRTWSWIALVTVAMVSVLTPLSPALAAPPSKSPPGTVTVSPSTAAAGTAGNAFTFRYATTSRMTGTVSVDVPAGWTPPQAGSALTGGFVSVVSSTCASATLPTSGAVTGTGPWTVLVNADCGRSKSFNLAYAGGGTAVTAPQEVRSYTFTSKVRTSSATAFVPLSTQPAVNVVAGPTTMLAVGGLADPMTAGIAGSLTVSARDAYGNLTTSYAGTVRISTTDSTGTIPADYRFSAADAGSHTFPGGIVLRTAGNHSVTVTDTSSSTITGTQNTTVVPAAADHLAFAVQPSDTAANATLTPSPTVRILDTYGNLTTSGSNVQLSLTGGPTSAALAGTLAVSASSGVATFNDLTVTSAAAGYQLRAASGALTPTTSSSFDIAAGPATSLMVGGLADPIAAGEAGSLTVTARDAYGNRATSYAGTVTLASTDSSGTLPTDYQFVAADAGAHTFPSSIVLRAAGNHSVTVTDTSSSTITGTQNTTVVPAAADHLAFAVQPSNTATSATVSPSPTVRILDAYGNLTASTATVQLSLLGGSGLAGTTSRPATAGVATFNDLSVTTAGSGYHLSAGSAALTPATSSSFDIAAGPATSLLVAGLADPMTAGDAGSLTVTARDAYGNAATSYAGTIRITSTDSSATVPTDYQFVPADAGTRTFPSGVVLRTAGRQGVTVTDVASSAIVGAQSVAVTAAAAEHLAFGVQPTDTATSAALRPSPTVRVLDAFGNLTSSNVPVQVSLTGGPAGAALSGTTTVPASSGVATFSDLSVATAGVGYQLSAASDALTSATSSSFDVLVGRAALGWGLNDAGQLGDGSAFIRNAPYRSDASADWAQAAAGTAFTVAVRIDGTLWAWGEGNNGRLGLGGYTDRSSPVQVGTASNWTSVTAGDAYTLAIKSDGTLWAWGQNSSGQLGDGTAVERLTPVQVGSGRTWRTVAAGGYHAVAVATDGTLWGWGRNDSGQVGDGTTTQRNAPVQVGSASNWLAVDAGAYHTVGIQTDATLWAAGRNDNGQLGDGTLINRSSPVQVGSGTSWSTVAAGYFHTAAVATTGTAWGWGYNRQGQVGDGTSIQRQAPVQVGTASNWTSVAGGGYHTMARTSDGALWGWGYNYEGAVGDGTNTDRRTPVRVGTASTWASVVAGLYHTVGIMNDGTRWSWGQNYTGELGDGYANSRQTPHPVLGGSDWASIAAGDSHAVAVKLDGSLWAWGYNYEGQVGDGTARNYRPVPAQISSSRDWSQVDGGYLHSVAVKTDGTLWAWGWNGHGQLGDGTNTTRLRPGQVGTASDWASVAAGAYYTVAVKTDGTLWSWGDNAHGQLGDGSTTSKRLPVQVGSATTWASVSAGAEHSVAVRTDGTVWTWGNNFYGQLGDGSTTDRLAPLQVGTATHWSSVAAGNYFTTGLTTAGTLWSWGANDSGQLGDGTQNQRLTPVQIGAATNWAGLATGDRHVLALTVDGALWSWGSASEGALGDGTRTNRTTPARVGTSTGWTTVAAGTSFSLALREG